MSERPLIDPGHDKIVSLPAETQHAPNGIVSRTILRTGNARIVLFGFSEGQELTEHTSTQEALIQILSGECEFSVAGKPNLMKSGDLLYMPANCRHAVRATKPFSMLLTLVKPAEKEEGRAENAEARTEKAELGIEIPACSSPSPRPNGFPSPPPVCCPTSDERSAFCGPRGQGGSAAAGKKDALDVDARGLEPPQPLVKILEVLGTLTPGRYVRARTDRRPMLLYPQLEERGFTAETEEQSDGSFVTQIRPR